MSKKSNECIHLDIVQDDVACCRVMSEVAGLPVRLGAERLSRDCRGDFESCLVPSALKAELLRLQGGGVDLDLLNHLSPSDSLVVRLLQVARNVNQVSDLNEVTDTHLLALYRRECPSQKVLRSARIRTYSKGFGRKSFCLLDAYLLKKGLIAESAYLD